MEQLELGFKFPDRVIRGDGVGGALKVSSGIFGRQII